MSLKFVPGRTTAVDVDSLDELSALRSASYYNATRNSAAQAASSSSTAAANGTAAANNTSSAPQDVKTTSFSADKSGAAEKPQPASSAKPVPKAAQLDEEAEAKVMQIKMYQHQPSLEEIFSEYETSTVGISSAEAKHRLERDGPNILKPHKATPEWVKFLKQMVGGFSSLLWIGSILCFIAYGIQSSEGNPAPDNLFLGVVLSGVVVITGVFSYFQESKSSSVVKKFSKLVPQKCNVWRDGKLMTDVDAATLVVGDVVDIKYGNKVPADIRILEASNLKVDNSSLTGESEPQKRSPECTHEDFRETQNLAFFTTDILVGSGKGLVVATGDNTYIGRIKQLVAETDNDETPIAKEIHHFIMLITSVAVVLGVTFFILAFVFGYFWLDAVIFLIGIIVANVPEGLLATVTVSLTLTALRMADKNVLVKQLESVETLGSTSTICSDKTGTLTQNKMTVAHVFYDGEIKNLGVLERDITFKPEDPSFRALWVIGQLCNTATFVYDEDSTKDMPFQQRKTNGDASESAILKFCDAVGAENTSKGYEESPAYREKNTKVLNIPFNSSNKFAGSVHKTADGREDGKLLFVMKGAPERIIARCSKMLIDGKEVPFTDDLRKKYDLGYEDLGRNGERVLGFAHTYLPKDKYPQDFEFEAEEPFNGLLDLHDMTFVGLMALIDPPREAVPSAVANCQSAGIQVIMVTGDHPITAKAIARSVNIITYDTAEDLAEQRGLTQRGGTKFEELDKHTQQKLHDEARAQVVTGSELRDMSEKDLDRVLQHEQIVFARTSPEQKLQIVQGCQRRGDVVAVTGDGVNDSPALRAADIGVAMGIAGSDVSKGAADMILMDDDFSSIVKGVEEGRLIFDNLKKSIAYTLTSNIPEISPFLIFILVQVPLPLSTIMILAIDLGTDLYPAISLAYERAEDDIMDRPPRDAKSDRLVTGRLLQMTYLQIGVIQALAGFFCYFVVMGDFGFLPSRLPGLRDSWDDEDVEQLRDSYGNEWTYNDRKDVERAAQTSYFVSIVIVQWADLIICKTRMNTVFKQGMRNRNLNFSLVFETCLALFLTYTPGMSSVFQTSPLEWQHFGFPAVSFSLLIFVYDETRRYLMRRYRRNNNNEPGWIQRETYW
ncbi:sodium/potassium-transporting ATPase subunit alpha-B [Salpingoeca rosetta]|uniref:Sodium/potassium-transporting ATPase subunit alpha-B n=1 Tax=Salpingoeca rosetta (strain ATCC 50818 / BSB-021) TaxID=946362 RepID=F2UGG2_SALR5|nr:sodium/potassium-transporting ATPase subunit alpha-B [Salpingoeca rosetta]EGD75712.1 sodium/potassium-transporting ATPase subunit alpha-B [Salpingoeca rosetta]|eukprot:XP_004991633.1 sodium/potassium-transporting ATPase subunit alpha-B [Salpingoeca rosetta]